MTTNNITIKIQDTDGSLLQEFTAERWVSIHQLAEQNKVDLPIACGAGACFVCAVKVLSGKEFLQQDLISPPLVELEEDQFLTCIGWVKNECFDNNTTCEIVLQKLL